MLFKCLFLVFCCLTHQTEAHFLLKSNVKNVFIKYIDIQTQPTYSYKTMAVFIFRNASFILKGSLSFLESASTRQDSVYFACRVKADCWSTHRAWEDVFVCTITAFYFSPLPSQTPPSIPHQAVQFALLKSSLFVSSESPLTGFCGVAVSNSFIISRC